MRILTASLILLLLTACATTATGAPGVDVYAAQATQQAAYQQVQLAANHATAQAAQATAAAVATQQTYQQQAQATAQASFSTAESLAYRSTDNAINSAATYAAIGAAATGTAVAQVAQAEAALIADEATRVSLQREAERIANEKAARWGQIWPWVAMVAALGLFAVLGAIAWRIIRTSQPIRDNGHIIALPANQYQSLPGIRITTPEPLALPPPRDGAIMLPPLTRGHVMIAGETGSGKSTAMMAALKRRQNVVVLDPHDNGVTWGGARVIGGGRDFEAIGEYMHYMRGQLQRRFEERVRENKKENDFEPMTVATDEMPAIVSALGRGIDETWREWLREGRKVGLFFVVSTQSTRVKTLGIAGEGDLLENFMYVIELGKLALNDFPELVEGMERPAVLRTSSGVQPVIIPYEPQVQPTHNNGAVFVAPQPQGLETKWGHVTAGQISRILQMTRAGESGRAIETAVFGYPGGQAYNMRSAVVERFATATGA